jgi:NitT/TauT family transport system ATP-binding protein
MLLAENIWKVYSPGGKDQVVAIRDLNLQVVENEFVSIIGPLGCGKSTFLLMAAGLDEPSAGKLLFEGRQVEGPSAKRGMVFQSYTLYPWLTVAENIRFALQKSGMELSAQKSLWWRSLSRWWGCVDSRTRTRINFRAGCASGWRLRGRWCIVRRCC